VHPDPSFTTTPAFYGRRGGRRADWWTLLHPPYTAWHLSYVVIGAAIAPRLHWWMLAATVLAFFLAVGVSAHALDELHGRPLGTAISTFTLWTASILGLVGAAVIGVLALPHTGPVLVPAIVVGVLLVLGYNLELFRGRMHTDMGFAIAWGGFPLAVGYLAQRPPLLHVSTLGALAAVVAAVALSLAQRRLSTPARMWRRRFVDVTATATRPDGTHETFGRDRLLTPIEGALRALSLAVPLLALTLLLIRAR
jgi:hypothetical protein